MPLDFAPFEKLYGPTAASNGTKPSPDQLGDAFKQSGLRDTIHTIAQFQPCTIARSKNAHGGPQEERFEYTSRTTGLTFISHKHSYTLDADYYCHDVVIKNGGHVIFDGRYSALDPSVDEEGRDEAYAINKIDPPDFFAHKRDVQNILRWHSPPNHSHPSTP